MSGASNGASAEHRDSSEALPRRESYEASIPGARSDVRLLRDLAADVAAQADKPELDYGIAGLNRHAPLPIRSVCAVVGPTGSGKTSLAMAIAGHRCAYRDKPAPRQGPTVYFAFELTPAHVAARRASQLSRFTQREILGGIMETAELEETLSDQHFYVVKPPRRRKGELYDYVQRVLDEVARRSPGRPLLVVDYLQRIRAGAGRDLRIDTSNTVDDLVDLTESRDMYTLLLSKGSREGSRTMRDGRTKGEALVDTGAETSGIEYGVAQQLVITYEDRDGSDTTDVRINVAKARYSPTGATIGMRFYGASGIWKELEAPPDTKPERNANERVLKALDLNPEGFASGNALSAAAKGNKAANLAAIKRMLVSGGPIERRGDRLCRTSGHA